MEASQHELLSTKKVGSPSAWGMWSGWAAVFRKERCEWVYKPLEGLPTYNHATKFMSNAHKWRGALHSRSLTDGQPAGSVKEKGLCSFLPGPGTHLSLFLFESENHSVSVFLLHWQMLSLRRLVTTVTLTSVFLRLRRGHWQNVVFYGS